MVFINRYYTQYLLTTVPSRYSINVVQNRCVITGRNWNVLKKTQYSRFCFRNESYKGFLPGVKRLSW